MPRIRSLDRIHRKGANGIGEAAIGGLHDAPLWGSARPGVRATSGPISRPARRVKSHHESLLAITKLRSCYSMDDSELSMALERAERAIQRIERAISNRQSSGGRDQELRERVREVVEELDELIRQAAA